MILGESVRQVVYFHLERIGPLKRNTIADDPKAFSSGLERIFGAGAKVVEKSIVKQLYLKLGLEYVEKTEYSFEDYVKEAKAKRRKKA